MIWLYLRDCCWYDVKFKITHIIASIELNCSFLVSGSSLYCSPVSWWPDLQGHPCGYQTAEGIRRQNGKVGYTDTTNQPAWWLLDQSPAFETQWGCWCQDVTPIACHTHILLVHVNPSCVSNGMLSFFWYRDFNFQCRINYKYKWCI